MTDGIQPTRISYGFDMADATSTLFRTDRDAWRDKAMPVMHALVAKIEAGVAAGLVYEGERHTTDGDRWTVFAEFRMPDV